MASIQKFIACEIHLHVVVLCIYIHVHVNVCFFYSFQKREKLLRERRVIGHEIKATATAPQEFAKLAAIRQTHFNWRRGRKLGELVGVVGLMGGVYICMC